MARKKARPQPDRRHRRQLGGEDQQPQHEEHRDLGQPGEGVVDPEQAVPVGQRAIAENHRRHVDREEPAGANQCRHAKGEEGEGQRDDRVEAAGQQAQAAEQGPAPIADRDPERTTDTELNQELDRQAPEVGLVGSDEMGDERRGEQDGHRVVEARFDLEGDADPLLELEPAAPQDGEDSRGVRRRDNRAQQERLGPGEAEQVGEGADQAGGRRDADGRQEARGPGHRPDGGEWRVESAVEEDEDQGDGAEAERESVVIKGDPADALRTRQHPEAQEDEGRWNTHSPECPAEDHAQRKENADRGQQQRGRGGFGGEHGEIWRTGGRAGRRTRREYLAICAGARRSRG